MIETMKKARDALAALAGPRHSIEKMKDYPCHFGITTPEKCGRCSRHLAAWDAMDEIDRKLAEHEELSRVFDVQR